MMLFQFLNQFEVLLVNSLSDFLGFMFFERSQQRFLLIGRNNIIGNFKKNRILFLDMLPQKPNVGLCLIDKNFLSNLVFRLHEGNRRKHQSYKTSSLFVFHQHHTDWTSVSQYAAFLHSRKENPLFLKMMALVGKMTEEIQRLLPTVQRLLHGSSRELFQHGKHALDDSVLIAKQFRGFLGMMMCATAWSLGHMRRVNALWLVRFNSIFHNFFSSPVIQLALSVLHMKTHRSSPSRADPSPRDNEDMQDRKHGHFLTHHKPHR